MQAVILAAGMGRRLGRFTRECTKCMVEVNGQRLIDRLMGQLELLGLSRVVVVTGYHGEELRRHLEENYGGMPLTFVENSLYEHTNNIYSLWLTRELLTADDTLLLESDLVFDDGLIALAVSSPEPDAVLVSRYLPRMDGTMVTLEGDRIRSFVERKELDYGHTERYFKTVNVYKFSREFMAGTYLPFLETYIQANGRNQYYEQALGVLTGIDRTDLHAINVDPLRWYEIDDENDLRIAEAIFAEPGKRMEVMKRAYGGYWRFPEVLDFCYLVNPCFPPETMIRELKASFEQLLRHYPSGRATNTMLMAQLLGVDAGYVCPGNGASELISSLAAGAGRTGVVCPTFEEYANRAGVDTEYFIARGPDFSYTASELAGFVADKGLKHMVLINPDNPSGRLMARGDVIRLAEACAAHGCRLTVDESFAGFADRDESVMDSEILESHPNITVVVSLSKCYGVPGLRLGAAVTADKDVTARLRRSVAIWNINSFAEFFMQIFGKYRGEYAESQQEFGRIRKEMYEGLSGIPGVRVIPSQANYFLCELPVDAGSVSITLLDKFGILVKDCSGKRGFGDNRRYIRVAVRGRSDNEYLVDALRRTLS